MTTALFEPFSGIAGDMTIAAFLDLGMPLDVLVEALATLPLDGYRLSAERVSRGAIEATRFVVDIDETHPHRGLEDIRAILTAGALPDRVLARALAAFTKLAEAEGAVHGVPPEEVHFHEVGAVDAIVDITGAALALEHFGVDEVLTTRIRSGTGEIECRHGRIPAPAPATALLLEGFPVRISEGEGETVTPTGAAILAAWATPAPEDLGFTSERTGYGAGTREDTHLPNALRVSLGARAAPGPGRDTVIELTANVDDQSPEITAFALERIFAAGALDAWITPVVMKKGRPGVVVSALADEENAGAVERAILRETTTFGVRRARRTRAKLHREHVEADTPWGPVRVKVGSLDGERITVAPEYEDCARLARENDVPLREVYAAARRGV
jgi:uncharacterized protein (TIGR00299 family) protein